MRLRILITGAGGFIGSHLCRYFSDQGHQVFAVHRPRQRPWRLRSVGKLTRVTCDLEQRDTTRAMIRALEPHIVVNCAAYGAYPCQTDRDRMWRVNFEAVQTLLDAVAGKSWFRCFAQAGSSSEYGLNCSAPDETGTTVPDSDYAVSKVAATSLVRHAGRERGVPAWCLRLYSVFGPYEETSRLIPQLLLRAMRKELPPFVEPAVSRDFVFISDVVRAFDRLTRRSDVLAPGDVFNIGSGVRTTMESLASTSRALFGIEALPRWGEMPNRRWDNVDWYGNPRKAGAVLDWRPEYTIEAGLRETMAWLRENPTLVRLGDAHSVMNGPGKSSVA